MDNDQANQHKKLNKILLIVVIVNLILWPLAIYLLLDAFQPAPATPDKMAYYAAKYVILEHLKSPSTAKFQDYESAEILTDGENTFLVKLWCDSQNSFGAMIRTWFSVLVKHEPENEQWRVLDLQEIK